MSLSDDSLDASGIDIVLKYPFVKDDNGRVFPKDVVEKFEEAIL